MPKALFEEMFDGPDSLFGQVFGPSRDKLKETAQAPKPKRIRLRLSQEQIAKLLIGESLVFAAGSIATVTIQKE